MSIDCPWQLYTFCLFHFCYSLGMYGAVGDPCKLITGDACESGAETYSARVTAFGFLYVAILFAVLTYINRRCAPKLKRLAMFATNCVVMLISGLLFTGSQRLGGVERSFMHFADMIAAFALLFITVSAMADGSEVAGGTPPIRDLGFNPKAIVFLAVIGSFVKILVHSDFLDCSSFVADPDSNTKVSHVSWAWMNITIFEILFALVFTLAYGNREDQEIITITFAVMSVVGIVSILPIADVMKAGLFKRTVIAGCIWIALALAAVIYGRHKQHHGYEAVSNT